MKRSKIFLAGTTCLLAIAGVAATKAHKITPRPVYYTSSNGHCTAVKVTACSLSGSGGVCRTGVAGTRTLYTISNAITPCHQVTGASGHISHFHQG